MAGRGSLYSSIGSSAIDTIKFGSRARNTSILRAGDQSVRQEKNRQMNSMFNALGQGVSLASGVYGNFMANRELSAFAKEKGFEMGGNVFSRVFGSPGFSKDGVEYDQSFLYGLKELEDYRKQKNLLKQMGVE